MPVNNSIDKQPTLDAHSKSQLLPLTVAQCKSDFSMQLSSSLDDINWLSIYPIVSQLINHFSQLPQPLLIFNARHWQAATEVIKASSESNFHQLALLNYDRETLFGRLNLQNEKVTDYYQGEIHNFNSGCLVLHISPLLVDPRLWFSLKAYLISHEIPISSTINGDKLRGEIPNLPIKKLQTKIILVSSRYQLDELAQIDPEYNQVGSLFTELSSEIQATDDNIQALQKYCSQLVEQKELPAVSRNALTLLFHHLSSLCEHQNKILFSPELIIDLLRYAQLFNTDKTEITAAHLQQALEIQNQAQSLAQNFSEEALLEKQISIQLKGEEIGQINGMSVIELLGYPTEFGEIFRISANDMIGDGEIIDVERKVELAGNIHAKSTLIVQGYLHHLFTHTENFPLSCNVVFEQSYQESDGDSAALAILLAVTSCYAQSPLAQNLFVTGALDQHGNVLAIGGINQKIKAVTRLFKLGLLNDPISILIPQANKINLTLDTDTLELISNKQVNIYCLNHCREAFPLVMGLNFDDMIKRINHRITFLNKDERDNEKLGLLDRIIQPFK